MLRVGLVLLVLACAGCAHNLPMVDIPNVQSDAARVRVFVDMNGTFFPPFWRSPDVVGEDAIRKRHSILAALAGDQARTARIDEFERDRLEEIKALAQTKSGRVFIFLLGFNNNQSSSAVELAAMQDAIMLGPEDVVVEFYWDGHDAKLEVDAARIWFWGTGTSQVVGSRALRRVLDAVADKEVLIVSFSRGASVVLSAMSNPAYSPAFMADTSALDFLGPRFLDPPPLGAGKPIQAIMLAPAVGNPDFWSPGSTGDSARYRSFPDRLHAVRFTVNPRDPILSKGGTGLDRHLNATDLGANPRVGQLLGCDYKFLHAYPVEGEVSHGSEGYIRDPVYARMLLASGATPRFPPPAEPTVAPIEMCAR